MARRRRKPKGPGWLEITGVIAGVVFIVLCIGYVASAYWMYGLLADIAQKDFTPANHRLDSYRQFFERMERSSGLEVEESPPYIKDGIKHFLWTVTIPGKPDRLIYHWQHDLNSNRVEPLTSPATYVDIEYGYIRPDQASIYPYIVGDTLALQIAKGIYSAGRPEEVTAESEPSAAEPEAEAELTEEAGAEPALPDEGGEEAAPGEDGNSGESNGEGDGGGTDEEEPPPDPGTGGDAVPIR